MTDYICTLSEEKQNAIAKWLEGNGLSPEETRLEMVDGHHTYTEYTYREAA